MMIAYDIYDRFVEQFRLRQSMIFPRNVFVVLVTVRELIFLLVI
jgi:hypothetical protein